MKDDRRPGDDDLDERLAELLSSDPRTPPPPDLCEGVLARTSGPSCPAAHALLGRVAESLSDLETELLGGHLVHCPACAQIKVALARLDRELPSLADLAPGSGFVERVLAATRPRPGRRRSVGSRLADVLESLLRRPRIAWETAFVGTAALWFSLSLLSDPALVTRATTVRSLALFDDAGRVTLETGQHLWSSTEESGRAFWSRLSHRVGQRLERTRPARVRLANEAERLKAAVEAATRDARGAWSGLGAAEGTSDDPERTTKDPKESP